MFLLWGCALGHLEAPASAFLVVCMLRLAKSSLLSWRSSSCPQALTFKFSGKPICSHLSSKLSFIQKTGSGCLGFSLLSRQPRLHLQQHLRPLAPTRSPSSPKTCPTCSAAASSARTLHLLPPAPPRAARQQLAKCGNFAQAAIQKVAGLKAAGSASPANAPRYSLISHFLHAFCASVPNVATPTLARRSRAGSPGQNLQFVVRLRLRRPSQPPRTQGCRTRRSLISTLLTFKKSSIGP